MYARWSVRMEAEDASASLGAVVIRFADQIGLTPAKAMTTAEAKTAKNALQP